jgi:hypothetical protein
VRSRREYGALLAACLALTSAAVPAAAREPGPLRGTTLGHTGLRLVVADIPPFVLDVDTGSVKRVRGADVAVDGILWVLGVSPNAAVVVADSLDPGTPNKQLYEVRKGHAKVRLLGTGRDLAPDATGRGIWVTRVDADSHCALRRLGLTGGKSVPRAIPCDWLIAPAGTLGLVVHRTSVIDPSTVGEVLTTQQGILAVAGTSMLLTGPGEPFSTEYGVTLRNTSTGSEQQLRRPGRIGSWGTPAIDPRGRYIALEFGDPSWHQSGTQVLDVWVLDTLTAKLTHVPGMPAFVHLKATSLAWTHDGRLVLLGEDDDGGFVGVWRPGQRRLPLKTLGLPARYGGSDSFAPLG